MTVHSIPATNMLTESQPMTADSQLHTASDDLEQMTLRSASVAATHRLGERLGRMLRAGDTVLLSGDLGAGKTALTQGIGRGLGIAQTINSPTFTILKEYQGRLPLYHFDLYRIEDPEELLTLGFEDYFEGEGVCVVEWADRAEAMAMGAVPWPEDSLRIMLRRDGMRSRALDCVAAGPRGKALTAALARDAASNQVE